MRRARTRKERRAKEQRAAQMKRLGAIGAIIGVIVLGASLPGFMIWRELTKTEIVVDANGCSSDVFPLHVVVLIDQTDPMEGRWDAFVQQVIPKLADDPDMPDFGRLSVYGLTDQRDAPLDEIVVACKPPNPGEGSFLFDTQAERNARQAEYLSFYADKVAPAARAAAETTAREASPILEGLRALQDVLLDAPADETRVVIISDMLQYTPSSPRYTHYGAYAAFEDFAATRAGERVKAYLPADEVIVHYVRRGSVGAHQDQVHVDFWAGYFAIAGVGTLIWNDDPLVAMASLAE